MTVFSKMPTIDIGKSLNRSEKIQSFLTPRDTHRLKTFLDCYAILNNQYENSLAEMSIHVFGRMKPPQYPSIEPSVNIAYWPGFDMKRINIESQNLTKLIKTIEPEFSQKAFLIYPVIEYDKNDILQNPKYRMIFGRTYTFPIHASAHTKIQAKKWMETIEKNTLQKKT